MSSRREEFRNLEKATAATVRGITSEVNVLTLQGEKLLEKLGIEQKEKENPIDPGLGSQSPLQSRLPDQKINPLPKEVNTTTHSEVSAQSAESGKDSKNKLPETLDQQVEKTVLTSSPISTPKAVSDTSTNSNQKKADQSAAANTKPQQTSPTEKGNPKTSRQNKPNTLPNQINESKKDPLKLTEDQTAEDKTNTSIKLSAEQQEEVNRFNRELATWKDKVIAQLLQSKEKTTKPMTNKTSEANHAQEDKQGVGDASDLPDALEQLKSAVSGLIAVLESIPGVNTEAFGDIQAFSVTVHELTDDELGSKKKKAQEERRRRANRRPSNHRPPNRKDSSGFAIKRNRTPEPERHL